MKIPWKEVLIALAIGLSVGWFGALRLSHHGMPEWKSGQMLERFSQKLSLTTDEKEKIGKILDAKREQITALRNEMRPRFDEIRNSSKDEIRKLLTPEQQTKFDKLEAEWESHRQKRRAEWSEK